MCVHGGPAWITTPTWSAPDFNTTVYTKLGYFVFFPNPRGSHGQGEAFTLANRRDWGFGDLSDILTGIDAVAKRLPIDKKTRHSWLELRRLNGDVCHNTNQ